MLYNLSKLTDYHLGIENHLPPGFQVATTQLAIITLSFAGLLYAPPAAEHGDSALEKTLDILGTCYTAIFMCYVATDVFIKEHIDKQYISNELKDVIKPALSSKNYFLQNCAIGFFAFLACIPYATTVVAYPFYPTWLFLLYLAYVVTATTLLHVLPVKLTLADPLYGLLPRLIGKLCNTIADFISNKQQIVSADEINFNQEKQDLIQKINNAKTYFLADLISSGGIVNQTKLDHYLVIDNTIDKLEYMLSFEQEETKPPIGLSYVARIVSSCIQVIATLGYAANPVIVIYNLTKSWWLTAILTVPSLYFFEILTIFFGDMFGQRILNDIYLAINNNSSSLPIEFRLFPITMSCCIMVNIFFLIFASAAAQEMMTRAFEPLVTPKNLQKLNFIAFLGISTLAWYGPQDFQRLIIRYITQYYRNDNAATVIKISSSIEALTGDIARMCLETNADDRIDTINYDEESKYTSICCYFPSKIPKDEKLESSEKLLTN